MSMVTDRIHIPEWSKGERMAKARRDAGLTQEQLANEISVSKRTIVKFENDQKEPSRGQLLLWQFVTRVPAEWLDSGTVNQNDGPDGGGIVGSEGLEPPTDTVKTRQFGVLTQLRPAA